MKKLIAAVLYLTCSVLGVQELYKPGTVAGGGKFPAFDSYRSFCKELDMTRIFSEDLGISIRDFTAANTANSLGEFYCDYPPIWVQSGQYRWDN